MKWTDLVNQEINGMVEEKEKLTKRLDKLCDSDNAQTFDKKVSLMVEIRAIDEAIFRFHVLLGKADQVDE